LVETGKYEPSRPPGFPLTELASAASYYFFGESPITWTVTNSVTCILFLISIWAIWALGRLWKVTSPLLAAFIYAFAPVNWVYSVETIDYIWTGAFLIFAVLAMQGRGSRSAILAGLFLGLASCARFSAALMVIPVLILLMKQKRPRTDIPAFLVSFILTVLVAYSSVLARSPGAGGYLDWFNYLNRVSEGMAEAHSRSMLERYLQPAFSLFGPLATIVLIIAKFSGFRTFKRLLRENDPGVWGPMLLALFIMVPYLWHLHQNYWIPAIGWLLLLLSKTTKRWVFVVCGAFILLANFPVWQNKVEGLGYLGDRVALTSMAVARYQNETIFSETQMRLYYRGWVEGHLKREYPSDWIIMADVKLPIIQFLVPHMEPVDLAMSSGRTLKVWRSRSGGPCYRYLLSPNQVADALASGYQVIYMPGMEAMYYAENRVRIEDVPGVRVLYEDE
jgi:hypothetical protein